MRAKLASNGVDYIPLDVLRDATDPILKYQRFAKSFRFRAAISRLRTAGQTVVLSEENWLGYPFEGCAFPPYPNAEARFRVVRSLGRKVKVFLAIRHPADFAASIFSEALRHDPNAVSLMETRERWLAGGSPWFDLVQRLSRHFDDITIWRHEDYRENAAAIVRLLTGLHLELPHVDAPRETLRLPLEEVTRIETVRHRGGLVPKADEWPVGKTRFEMFDDNEREDFSRTYNADILRIEQSGLAKIFKA